MEGAIAISSVSAWRQAEISGGFASDGLDSPALGVAGSAVFSGAAGAALALSGAACGASAGRGRGNGTFAVCAVPRFRGGPKRSSSLNGFDAVAGAGPAGMKTNAVAVTIAARLCQMLP